MKITYRILVLLSFFALVSCFDEPGTEIVWGDQAYLELDRAGQPNPTVNTTFNRLNNGTTFPLNIQFNIMGRKQSGDVNVTYEIEATSTAIQGVHYTKPAGNTITIPAGELTANLTLTVNPDVINPGQTFSVIVRITGGDLPLSNYVRATFNLRTVCPFARANFVRTYNCTEPGYGTYPVIVSADPADPDVIITNNFWDFGGAVRYRFVTTAGVTTLTLPTQNVVMGGVTYTVSQNGTTTFNACGDQMVIPYRVVRTSDGALQDTNIHTYNRQ